jgi:hypothetical protein
MGRGNPVDNYLICIVAASPHEEEPTVKDVCLHRSGGQSIICWQRYAILPNFTVSLVCMSNSQVSSQIRCTMQRLSFAFVY